MDFHFIKNGTYEDFIDGLHMYTVYNIKMYIMIYICKTMKILTHEIQGMNISRLVIDCTYYY